MCAVKKPKIKDEKPKELPILRNPLLDGMLGNIAALRNGRNAFRINLANPLAIPVGGGPTIGGGFGGGFGGGGGSGGGSSSGGGGSSSGGSGSSTGGIVGGGGGSVVYGDNAYERPY